MNSRVACEILKLPLDYSVEDLQNAFRKLRKHKSKSPGAIEQSVQVKQAYEFLLKLKKENSNSSEPSSTQNQPPPPTEVKLDLTLEEILTGGTRNEKIYRRVLDEFGIVEKMEERILDVPITPGILAGTRITIKNQGDIHHDKIPADVVFIVREKQHETFSRSKFDLKYTTTITSEDAIFGCDLKVPSLDSKVFIPLSLNGKVDEKTELRIPSYGLPILDEPEKRGDIVVNFKIVKFQSNMENSSNKEQLSASKFNLALTLEEIFHGCVKSEKIIIKITDRQGNVRKEEKILQVNVKPGSIQGSRITIPYSGDMSYGKITADVIFTVIEKPSLIFKTIKHDLFYYVKISPKEAIFGGELDIPTLDNESFKFAFNGGITPESEQRIPKMGLPNENDRGDLIVKFEILFWKDSKTIDSYRSQEKLPPNKFNLKLTLEELFLGCKKYQRVAIKIVDQNGKEDKEEKIFKIKLTPGSFDDIVFPFEGDREYGKIEADVIFVIVEEPHALFKRNGQNIEFKAKVTTKEAILGGILQIPTLERGQVNLILNKPITPSTVMSIPGQGFPIPNTNGERGDIIVLFEIIF